MNRFYDTLLWILGALVIGAWAVVAIGMLTLEIV